MQTDLVPALDAAGLPGPPWLFHILLVFTFVLHLLFMNLTLGGTLLAWVSHLRATGEPGDPHGRLAARMVTVNSFAISLTITTGVAPLLFLQLLYQPFFYTGTILLGWIWFGLLVFLTAGYYAVYAYKLRGAPARGTGGGFWLGFAAVAFTLIAMIQVAAHLVQTRVGSWQEFAANPWIVLGDPVYWPRLFHFVFAGIGFAALVMAWWAARQAVEGSEVEINTAIARTCWRWALGTVIVQVTGGFVLLVVLPRDILIEFMRGGAATMIPLTLSIVLGVGLLAMLARSIDPVKQRGLVTGSLAAMILTVAIMTVTRDQVRELYLAPSIGSEPVRIVPQWGNFGLFAVLLVAALWAVYYMTRRVLSEPATGEDAA